MYWKISKLVSLSAFKKPATRLYPFTTRPSIKGTRGHIAIDVEKCTMCTLCQKKCPTAAIVVNRTEKTWQIDRLKCIACSACVDCCPKDCLTMEGSYSPSQTEKSVDSFVQQAKPAA